MEFELPQDFKELFQLLNANNVRYTRIRYEVFEMIETRLMKKVSVLVASLLVFAFSIAGWAQTPRRSPRRSPPADFFSVKPADILITGGTIVTMNKDRRVIEN